MDARQGDRHRKTRVRRRGPYRESPPGAVATLVAEVADIASDVWWRGWAEGSAGNLSVDVTREMLGGADPQLAVLVTTAGSRLRDIARAPERGLLILACADGRRIERVLWSGAEPTARPTSELAAHLAIHEALHVAQRGPHAILHAHPTHLTALTHSSRHRSSEALNEALRSMLPELEAVLPEGIALVPHCRPGSGPLADATAAAALDHRVILWQKHGALAVERDLATAFDLMDTLEKAARTYLLCRGAGFVPAGSPDG
jgi:rhamnulose-1-phosphate aldolase